MKRIFLMFLPLFILAGCASNVRFTKTNEAYVPQKKRADSKIVFKQDKIQRPHTVIGIITAELGKNSRRPELNALIVKKAREIGADGVMLVEYDIDRDVYIEHHHGVVGHGPWRRHVVSSHPRAVVKKTASAIAVVFK